MHALLRKINRCFWVRHRSRNVRRDAPAAFIHRLHATSLQVIPCRFVTARSGPVIFLAVLFGPPFNPACTFFSALKCCWSACENRDEPCSSSWRLLFGIAGWFSSNMPVIHQPKSSRIGGFGVSMRSLSSTTLRCPVQPSCGSTNAAANERGGKYRN